jgi:hypothetical protein
LLLLLLLLIILAKATEWCGAERHFFACVSSPDIHGFVEFNDVGVEWQCNKVRVERKKKNSKQIQRHP